MNISFKTLFPLSATFPNLPIRPNQFPAIGSLPPEPQGRIISPLAFIRRLATCSSRSPCALSVSTPTSPAGSALAFPASAALSGIQATAGRRVPLSRRRAKITGTAHKFNARARRRRLSKECQFSDIPETFKIVGEWSPRVRARSKPAIINHN